MTITNHPFHRSGRARLTHPALASGDDAKSLERIRMMEGRQWQPEVNQMEHPLPREAGFLTASPQRRRPASSHVTAKRSQRVQGGRNPVISIMSLHHGPQPLSHIRHRLVHSQAQFHSNFLQLSAFPLTHRAPIDRKHSVASLLATDVREAKKVECLGLPFAASFSILGRKVAKLDDARFLGMQFQFELGEAFPQFVMKPRGVRLVLKAHHEVISPANHNHVAFGLCLTPVLHPEVEHVMQVDVSQQGRGTAALWRSFSTACPLFFFQHACVQPFTDEPQHALVRHSMLDELNQPFVVQTIEERADVAIQHPVHPSRQQTGVQSIQRIMLALAGPVAIGEAEKVSLIDSIQHRHRRALDQLVFQRRDSERSLPPVSFGDEYSTHWLRSVSPTPQPRGKFCEIALQLLSVLLPRFPINSRGRITFQPVVGFAQHAQVVDVVHEAGEPQLLIFHRCLPYSPQRTLHVGPVQCPVRVLPWRLPFGQTPSLHLLRRWRVYDIHRWANFVRGLRCYYGFVRLPAAVHHRRVSLDFAMRPKRAGLSSRRSSRFSRGLFPCMPGVSDLAGSQRALPKRHVGCGLPLLLTESASRTKSISRLNTQPARTPVNASPSLLRAPPHDSGPLWLASPLTYETFIHYNPPVYPGAPGV